jgi:hypothetical protein
VNEVEGGGSGHHSVADALLKFSFIGKTPIFTCTIYVKFYVLHLHTMYVHKCVQKNIYVVDVFHL